MRVGITEVPDDFLKADGDKRWKWVNVLANTMPPRIKVPLQNNIATVLLDDNEMDKAPASRVALYKRTECRGKYDEYEYCGDDYI